MEAGPVAHVAAAAVGTPAYELAVAEAEVVDVVADAAVVVAVDVDDAVEMLAADFVVEVAVDVAHGAEAGVVDDAVAEVAVAEVAGAEADAAGVVAAADTVVEVEQGQVGTACAASLLLLAHGSH